MKLKLFHLWAHTAREVAKLSTCSRLQVGCLLLSLDGERLLSFGYNGGPRGLANQPKQDEPGNEFWIHAEANALVKTRPVEPFICLLTHTPCVRCAGLLINSQAFAVWALEEYRDLAGWELLAQSYSNHSHYGPQHHEAHRVIEVPRRGIMLINSDLLPPN